MSRADSTGSETPASDRMRAASGSKSKIRLDQLLVDRELFESREKAKRAILAGQIRVSGQLSDKPGTLVKPDELIDILATEKYVSRGGHKLEHALKHFGLRVDGCRALDVGASTGGFTDCLLQFGADSVCAVDVGQGQLAWKLRQDPRVWVLEKTNARNLTPKWFLAQNQQRPWRPFDAIVVDCSFISLRLILPPVVSLLRPGGTVIGLIKPQFEAGKAEVDRGSGVIRDPEVHQRVLRELENWVAASLPELNWRGTAESPLLGPAGNREFLVHLVRP